MNVLSLFDGMSCGQIALERAGIQVDNYYSSEIDKYAIQITQKNYPNTIQLGDINNWQEWDLPNIDLIMGGSPCTGFSNAGKGLNFNDPRSKLFFVFVDILKHYSPEYFLLENVKMKKEWQDVITEYMGVDPILINSALVSAQNRKRLYWSNINFRQPSNKNLSLSDILLKEVEKKYFLSKKEKDYMDRETKDGRNHWDFAHHSDTDRQKSAAVVANFFKGVPYNVLINRNGLFCPYYDCDFAGFDEDFCKGCQGGDMWQGENYPTQAIRKFHPIECERLQTVPDNYTDECSNTQRYKMIGNGWTIDVVAHILKEMKK